MIRNAQEIRGWQKLQTLTWEEQGGQRGPLERSRCGGQTKQPGTQQLELERRRELCTVLHKELNVIFRVEGRGQSTYVTGTLKALLRNEDY